MASAPPRAPQFLLGVTRLWALAALACALIWAPSARAQAPLTINPTTLPLGGVGQDYFAVFFASGGSGPQILFSISAGSLPPGLSLSSNGLISGAPNAPGVYSFTVKASSSQPALGTANLSITILGITTPSALPDAKAGQTYGQAITLNTPTAATWSITNGSLPPGMALTAGGGVSGVPGVPGTYSFEVTASVPNPPGAAISAKQSFSLNVTGVAPITLVSDVLPLVAISQSFSFQMRASGGTGTYTWIADALPPNFNLTSDGLLTANATQSGIFSFVFRIQSGGVTTDQFLTYVGVVDIATATPLDPAQLSVAYSQQFFVTFGVPTWSLIGGSLPPGFSFGPDGLLQGTPTQLGSYQFTVQAVMTNAGGTTTLQRQMQLSVVPPTPVTISTLLLPYAGLNQSYAATLTATGGDGTFTWTATGLPAGLLMSTAGTILGTPQAPGAYPIIVTAQSLGIKGSASVALIVVQVDTNSLPGGFVAQPYLASMSVTTGFSNWSLVSGQLPLGLSLTQNGFITGTPTTAGTSQFRVRATVPNIIVGAPDVVVERDLSINIGGLRLTLLTQSLNPGQVRGAYTEPITVQGGDPPYRFTASGLPEGLSLSNGTITGVPSVFGSFQVTVGVSDTGGASITRNYQLEIAPVGPLTGVLHTSPSILHFTVPAGGELSAAQSVNITSSSNQTIAFTAEAVGATWMQIETGVASTPRALQIRASSSGLVVGSYTGTLRLSVPDERALEMTVLLDVVPSAPRLDASPSVVRFSANAATPGKQEKLLVLSNSGGGLADYRITVANNSRWITSTTADRTQARLSAPSYVRVAIDTQGLAPGAYRDILQATTATGTTLVPVTLFVAPAGPALELSSRGVQLHARQGQGDKPSQTIVIRNAGAAGTAVNWKADILRGDPSFVLSPASGTVLPGAPANLNIALKPELADTPGTTTALIRVADSDGHLAPRYVVAVAQVVSTLMPAPVTLAPAGLLFTASQNGSSPVSQAVVLSTSNTDSMHFAASASSFDPNNWLSVSPAQGDISSSSPLLLAISVTAGGLAPGLHSGLVHVAIGDQLATVMVEFSIGAQQVSGKACQPASVALTQTALAGDFSAFTGWPVSLNAHVTDDCGLPLANASVTARFTNGDAPLDFAPVADASVNSGNYSATWQPVNAAPFTTITLEASAPGLTPVRIELTGTVPSNPANPPVLSQGGVLNNLSGAIGGALAPGTVTQIFGQNLAAYTTLAAAPPLPTDGLGVEALVGDLQSPVYYFSPNQLTVQLPNELSAYQTHSAVLAVRGAFSLPEPVDIVPVQPAAFSVGGMLMAYHADGSPVSETSPARPGELLSIYLVGMGSTKPAVVSGKASPRNPAAVLAASAGVSVNGFDADILFQGLVPDQVGLYQIVFRVPAGVQTGLVYVAISQTGIAAQSGMMLVQGK